MIRLFIVLSLLTAVLGCATTDPNPALLSARSAVQAAEQDPVVLESASVELDRARQSLQATEAIFDENGNREAELLEHQAYLTERYAEIAVSQAQAARLQDEIESADGERSRVLLEARRIEVARAESEVARAQALAATQTQQAMAAQAQAIGAEERAAELQRRLEELQAEETERGIVLTLGDVLFDTGRAELKPGADPTISQLAAFLGEYAERSILIEGHTDSAGSEDYNLMLSEQRANAVLERLLEEGVAADRIRTRGLGESSPVAGNETAAGRQQNRRVEVVISDEDGGFLSQTVQR